MENKKLASKTAESIVEYVIALLKKEKIKIALEKARKLPLEKQSEAFFNIYLELERFIVENRPRIKGKELTLTDLREKIREQIDVENLEDRFQLLFLRHDELLVKLIKDLIKECINNFIDKKLLIEAEKEIIKEDKILEGVTIDENGEINFKPLFANLEKIKANRLTILNTALNKLVSATYERIKGVLGELQAKNTFEVAYSNLQKKYGVNLLKIFTIIPEKILEAEKLELLTKEEIEKKGRELVKIEREKGEFMDIAAHELKTPLVPIIGYSEMLLADKTLPKKHREKIKLVLDSAKREKNLVDDVLDASKVDTGTMKFEFEDINMIEFLKEAIRDLELFAKEKKLSLKLTIPEKLPFTRVDKKRLIQVINNLIKNSIKFTEKGKVEVKASVVGKEIVVSVTDTGMGIAKEDMPKLFTKFFQTKESRKISGGTGLGLAICKGIVEGHGGKIWAESEGVGKGSTFSFTIPILLAAKKSKEK